jgi:hypothetical protein
MHARTTILAAVLAALALAGNAFAAGPRPLFQMPVPCGQTWEASTYDGHWPDQDSVDLAERDGDGGNISEGEPVLASAAGTVTAAFQNDSGDYRVYIDHGGGWTTHYIHNENVEGMTVGRKVAQGEQIGRTFNSGADAMHIHYTQLRDGEAVRIAFDGDLIDTHQGDEGSWGHWGNGEELTSLNCPGNSFLGFNQNGMHYELLYKPGPGEMKIVRTDADGTGVTTTASESWTRGWTHLVPFTLSGGQQHMFTYKSSSGRVRFARLDGGGSGDTELSDFSWWAGWTHFAPFSLGGKPYFLAYDSVHGYVNIDRINAEGSGSTKIFGSTWTKGWTQVVPFTQNAGTYLFLYKGGTGAAKVLKLTGSGDDVDYDEVWSDTWTTGWTHLVPLKHNGAVHLLAYKAASGTTKFLKVNAGGLGVQTLGQASWTTQWTSFSPLLIDGDAHVLGYKAGSGETKVLRLNGAGSGISTIWTGAWTTGWA